MGSNFNPLGNMQRNIAGEPEYKKIPPDSIHQFRGLPQSEKIEFPEKFQNRKCTDIAFVIILLLFALSMYAFTIAMCFRPQNGGSSDESPLSESRKGGERGYDGYDNNPYNNDPDHNHRNNEPRSGEEDEKKAQTFGEAIKVKCWVLTCVGMPVIGFVIMMLVFVGLRYKTKVCFWILTVIDLIMLTVFCGYYWYLAVTSGDAAMNYIFNAIVYTVFLIFMIVVIICLRKRLPLIFATYEEALKAIFKVPALLFTPLLTLIVMLISMTFIVYVPIICFIRGVIDGAFYAFMILSSFKFYWVIPFTTGSQCMVVAFAVATYYFTRDKSNIRSPYCRSLYSYFRFHTGTVAAGSFIIAVIRMVQSLVQGATNNAAGNRNLCGVCLGCCCMCCLAWLEEIVQYITTKAYIMTAIHGKSLCKSGKRAMRLLWTNLLDTIAVDSIGGLAMSGAVVLIFAASFLVGFLATKEHLSMESRPEETEEQKGIRIMNFVVNGLIPLSIGFFLTALISGAYMQVLSVAIQTIFLCFCEDKEINDGSADRPYYMGQNLLNIIQKAFNDKLAKEQAAANR